MPKRPLFNRVSIIGLGLIGGSLGLALKRAGAARRIYGFSRHEATVRQAKRRGAITDGDTELCPDWLGESELVILAVPPEKVVPVAREVARLTKHSFVLTDAASTKGAIVAALDRLPSRIAFIGSHPMAGSEKSGIEAAHGDLFEGAPCVVTPTRRTKKPAAAKAAALWRAVGGKPVFVNPAKHDELVARVSHLPHLAAVGLTLAAGNGSTRLSAGGFADTTRIALSNPAMWREICLSNRKEILRSLKAFRKELARFESLVARGDGKELGKLFIAAQKKRRAITK
jgi:prephenate dehydrogenase